jgi:hypothetical protein
MHAAAEEVASARPAEPYRVQCKIAKSPKFESITNSFMSRAIYSSKATPGTTHDL